MSFTDKNLTLSRLLTPGHDLFERLDRKAACPFESLAPSIFCKRVSCRFRTAKKDRVAVDDDNSFVSLSSFPRILILYLDPAWADTRRKVTGYFYCSDGVLIPNRFSNKLTPAAAADTVVTEFVLLHASAASPHHPPLHIGFSSITVHPGPA